MAEAEEGGGAQEEVKDINLLTPAGLVARYLDILKEVATHMFPYSEWSSEALGAYLGGIPQGQKLLRVCADFALDEPLFGFIRQHVKDTPSSLGLVGR